MELNTDADGDEVMLMEIEGDSDEESTVYVF